MARIVWSPHVLDVIAELPSRESDLIFEKTKILARFPRLFPVRAKGRFRRYRWVLAGRWIVYYKVSGNTAYIRILWPAQIP